MSSSFNKKCPVCLKDMFYKNAKTLSASIKKNRKCHKCKTGGFRGKRHTDESKKLISNSKQGHAVSDETKQKMSNARIGKRPYIMTDDIRNKMSNSKLGTKCVWYGKKHSLKTKQKMSESHKGKNSAWYGKNLSAEHKEKLRMARLKFVKDKYRQVYYNPNACLYFDKLEKKMGWDGYYATKNSEFQVSGYSVDYYEPNFNIVVEYDEPHHYNLNGTLKSRDKKRQSIITEQLNCKFWRYNELTGELKCAP